MNSACVYSDCYNTMSEPGRGGETLGAGEGATFPGGNSYNGPIMLLYYFHESREIKLHLPWSLGELGSGSLDLNIRYTVCCPCSGNDGLADTILHEMMHHQCLIETPAGKCDHSNAPDADFDRVAKELRDCIENRGNCPTAKRDFLELRRRW